MSCYRTLEASGPLELAQMLDLWALRREKVLEVLDVRAAKKARRLARACRTLALAEAESTLEPMWQRAWQGTCRDAVMLLGRVAVSRVDPISQRTTVKSKRVTFIRQVPCSPQANAGRPLPSRRASTLTPPPAPSVKYHGLRGA